MVTEESKIILYVMGGILICVTVCLHVIECCNWNKKTRNSKLPLLESEEK